MTPQPVVVVQACECPFCLNEDHVRGFKVGDKHGWWSECTNDHTQFNEYLPPEEQFRPSQGCWFIWKDDDVFLLESPTSGRVAEIHIQYHETEGDPQ